MTQSPAFTATSTILLNSSGAMTLPVGLDGDLIIRSFDFGVIARSTASAVKWKSVDSVGIGTILPSAKAIISGNETQQGFSTSTSSPGWISESTALNMTCLPPTVMQHWSG